jgi:hypothetical protein
VVIPLCFSSLGTQEGATTLPLLVYFSCLGAGFITLELVYIQKFTHLIGSALYPALSHLALALPLVGRIAAVGLMIFPLGFFLGMPFPLGVLAIANHPRGAIA